MSTSVGRRGAWFTERRKGTRSTVGLPGSELSYTKTRRSGGALAIVIILIVFAAFVLFWSALFCAQNSTQVPGV